MRGGWPAAAAARVDADIGTISVAITFLSRTAPPRLRVGLTKLIVQVHVALPDPNRKPPRQRAGALVHSLAATVTS